MRLSLLNPKFAGNARPLEREAIGFSDKELALADQLLGQAGSLRRMLRGAGSISPEQIGQVRRYFEDNLFHFRLPETPEQFDLDSPNKFQILLEATVDFLTIRFLVFRNPNLEEYGRGFLVRCSIHDNAHAPSPEEIDVLLKENDVEELTSRLDTPLSLFDLDLRIIDEIDDVDIFDTNLDGLSKTIDLRGGEYKIFVGQGS